MNLLIDGYNLLNSTDLFGRGPNTLESSRRALLEFLAGVLSPEDCRLTTVVFDAAGAPPGLPRQWSFRGISVQFAGRREEADDLLERLIESSSAPRRLTVVSSDHRVQRAARRRRSRAIDSDLWYLEVRRDPHPPPPEKPTVPNDVASWLEAFDMGDAADAETGTTEDRPKQRASFDDLIPDDAYDMFLDEMDELFPPDE